MNNYCREHGPLTLKNRPRWWLEKTCRPIVAQSEAAPAANGETHCPTRLRNGCAEFICRLKQRKFAGPTDLPVMCLNGHEVTFELLSRQGFHVPVLVDCKDGLDITVPGSSMTAHDIEDLVGSMRELDVIDVAEQRERKMLMREWVEYYLENDCSIERSLTLNLISLEFSATKLGKLVDPPAVVKALSWVDRFWPAMRPNIDSGPTFIRPEVVY